MKAEQLRLKIVIDEPLYIKVVIADGSRIALLRRWPWPKSKHRCVKHFADANKYAQSVGGALLCPIEIDPALFPYVLSVG